MNDSNNGTIKHSNSNDNDDNDNNDKHNIDFKGWNSPEFTFYEVAWEGRG